MIVIMTYQYIQSHWTLTYPSILLVKQLKLKKSKIFSYSIMLLEFIRSNIIGPLITNLICMSRFRSPFEDLSDMVSFKLSLAECVRIPVQDINGKDLVRNLCYCILYSINNLNKCKCAEKKKLVSVKWYGLLDPLVVKSQ